MDLHYNHYGSAGPPLIILHGLLGASGNWHTLSRTVFSDHFEVFAVDQRNHGRSPHADAFNYEVMAEDVRIFIQQHDLGRVHLLGHSMGGKTAMRTALDYPDLVDQLVVADMAPKAYPPHHLGLMNALRKIDPATYDDRSAIDDALAEDVPSYPIRQFLLKNLAYDADHGYAWQMNLDVIHEQYDQINQAITHDGTFDGPVLFVRGSRSDYVRTEDLPHIRTLFPQAKLTTVKEAGHWVHAEAPQDFSETVVAFLKEGGPS